MVTTVHCRHDETLGFTITAVPRDYAVDFVIYEIDGWMESATKGVFDVPTWRKAGSSSTWVKTLEEAEPYLHGSVKRDGCSNWHFDEQDRGCRRGDLLRFGEVMAKCWDWTAELCPHWIA